MGGGKGGADFDPKGKSNREVMAFCQSFMTELCRHIGPNTDVPAGDLGGGGREVAYMFGQYKRIRNEWTGVLTGKGLTFGGSLARTEAYRATAWSTSSTSTSRALATPSRARRSSSTAPATWPSTPSRRSRSSAVPSSPAPTPRGWVEDPEGIDYQVLEHIYNKKRSGHDAGREPRDVRRRAPQRCLARGRRAVASGSSPVTSRCPAARENTLHLEDAQALVANGCKVVGEGANMPTTPDATTYLMENGVAFMPGKAANAGGVLVSGLEMSQNAESTSPGRSRRSTAMLREPSCAACSTTWDDTAREYGHEGNLRDGRQHRRLPQGRRGHDGPGRVLTNGRRVQRRAACSLLS